MNRTRGFTLVELMVASAILVTLLAAYLGAYKNIMTVSGYTQGMTLAQSACMAKLEEIMADDFDLIPVDYAAGGTPGNTFDINVSGTSGFQTGATERRIGAGRITITDRPELYGGGENSVTTNLPVWAGSTGRHTSLVYNNKMWIIGGFNGTSYSNGIFYTDDFDLAGGQTWTLIATSPATWPNREGHTSLVYNNRMWVMGGYDGVYKNDIWYTDDLNLADGQGWMQLTTNPPMWTEREGHASLVYKNEMWVIGGYGNSGVLNDVWHSAGGQTWTQATANAFLGGGRYGHTSLVYNNEIWVMGGYNGSYLNEVWHSADDGQTWTQVTTNLPIWPGRWLHTSLVYDNKMWIIGGYGNSGVLNDIWYTDDLDLADGQTWTQAVTAWPGRQRHTSLVYDNQMWIIRGEDSTAPQNDVRYSSGYNRLLEIIIEACWRQPDGRVFGEDLDLDGIIDEAGEDVNGNGKHDPGTRIRVLLSDTKNMGNLRRTYFGR